MFRPSYSLVPKWNVPIRSHSRESKTIFAKDKVSVLYSHLAPEKDVGFLQSTNLLHLSGTYQNGIANNLATWKTVEASKRLSLAV